MSNEQITVAKSELDKSLVVLNDAYSKYKNSKLVMNNLCGLHRDAMRKLMDSYNPTVESLRGTNLFRKRFAKRLTNFINQDLELSPSVFTFPTPNALDFNYDKDVKTLLPKLENMVSFIKENDSLNKQLKSTLTQYEYYKNMFTTLKKAYDSNRLKYDKLVSDANNLRREEEYKKTGKLVFGFASPFKLPNPPTSSSVGNFVAPPVNVSASAKAHAA